MTPNTYLHRGGSLFLTWAVTICWTCTVFKAVLASYTPFLPQGFLFSWTPVNQSPPVPTTAQCETIPITWSRSTATGPNPTAPYSLQVFTSAFIVPFSIAAGDPSALSFDWTVPFIPGTQYQICMWDANGVSGGCQATYTIYQAPNTTLADPPICPNVTFPREDQVLSVDAQVDTGPMSQYGWIDQCTDISITPKNGTPPYTLTVAPSLHPPYNITSHNMDPINWTVSLSYGMPFFISLVDSAGNSWANGPLHSGGGGTTECLSQDSATTSNPKKVQPWVAGVSGVAGVIVGLLAGFFGAIYVTRRARELRILRPDPFHRKSTSTSTTIPTVLSSLPHDNYRDSSTPTPGLPPIPSALPPGVPPTSGTQHFVAVASDTPSNRALVHNPSRHFEPFAVLSDQELAARTTSPTPTSGAVQESTSPSYGRSTHELSRSASAATSQLLSRSLSDASMTSPSDDPRSATSHVYVVHHDAGRPPVTVYTADGTEVVELPPRYNESESPTPGSAEPVPAPPSQAQERSRQASAPKPLPTQVRRVVNA